MKPRVERTGEPPENRSSNGAAPQRSTTTLSQSGSVLLQVARALGRLAARDATILGDNFAEEKKARNKSPSRDSEDVS